MENKMKNIQFNELKDIVSTSKSWKEILQKMGYTMTGYNYKRLKELLDAYNLNFESNKLSCGNHREPLENILTINSAYTNRFRLKIRILNENLLKYECDFCQNTGQWMGKKLSLQLDHINGINNDNRIENLRFLCPNCHIQTDTFGGKKRNYKLEM
jgi:hypothetical protein